MTAPIRSHCFAGRRYRVSDLRGRPCGCLGECQSGERASDRVIRIPVSGDTLPELDTIIHEAMHAACPYLAEEAITSASTDISRLLWRMGWRKDDG